ncbi:hypothetical protein A8709_07200 [Paenibacillus pectinilyticus]|uniref:DNA-binding response regulator n=1 Tax=Paenibacillus pectinilyticus TaxID=512399 RepID=A0A1C0ZTN7_9BACL|nr:response regulator [Paenibacillus pectinilyticus]OCT11448.1 hypothetical protein A8709_07200 [Paenibacillus pectinilyticus]
MYKVILADDDEFVLEGFKRKIDWVNLGLELVGTASDGLEAIKLVKELDSHILITDIRMPIMDGIMLIESLRKVNSEIKVIIISGYSEFEYAQKAVKLKAMEYLLKPTSKEDVENALKKLVEVLNQENYEELQKEQILLENRENMDIVFKHLVLSILEDSIEDSNHLFIKLTQIKPGIMKGKVVVSLVEIDNLKGISMESLDKGKIISDLYKIIETSAQKSNDKNLVLKLNENRFAIVMFFDEKLGFNFINNKVIWVLHNLMNSAEIITHFSITATYGPIVENVLDARRSFIEAFEALKHKLLFGKKSLIKYTDINKIDNSADEICLENEKKLVQAIERLQYEQTLKCVDEFYAYLAKGNKCSYPYILSVSFKLLTLAKKLTQQENSIGNEFLIWEQLNSFETVEEIHKWLRDVLNTVMLEALNKNNNNYSSAVNFMVDYIQKNYVRNITLRDISNEIFLSENYLTTLFKKEMGITFKKYLINTRMEKAKLLLADPKYKIFEIANLVGYESEEYFSNIFKESVGLTPKGFRNNTAFNI